MIDESPAGVNRASLETPLDDKCVRPTLAALDNAEFQIPNDEPMTNDQ